jgi:hypothetical protein
MSQLNAEGVKRQCRSRCEMKSVVNSLFNGGTEKTPEKGNVQ